MKRHPFDTVSFVFGAVFTLFGLTFLIMDDPWDIVFGSANFTWVMPAILLVAGAAMMLSILRPGTKAVTDSPITVSRGEVGQSDAELSKETASTEEG